MIKDKDNYINPECVVLAEKKNSVNTLTLDSGKKVQVSDEVFEEISSYSPPSPSGNIEITDTNITDVKDYATAQVVDENLVPENIKKDVNVLGVTGTVEEGGVLECPKQKLTIKGGKYYTGGSNSSTTTKCVLINAPIIKVLDIKLFIPYTYEFIDVEDGTYELSSFLTGVTTGTIAITSDNSGNRYIQLLDAVTTNDAARCVKSYTANHSFFVIKIDLNEETIKNNLESPQPGGFNLKLAYGSNISTSTSMYVTSASSNTYNYGSNTKNYNDNYIPLIIKYYNVLVNPTYYRYKKYWYVFLNQTNLIFDSTEQE